MKIVQKNLEKCIKNVYFKKIHSCVIDFKAFINRHGNFYKFYTKICLFISSKTKMASKRRPSRFSFLLKEKSLCLTCLAIQYKRRVTNQQKVMLEGGRNKRRKKPSRLVCQISIPIWYKKRVTLLIMVVLSHNSIDFINSRGLSHLPIKREFNPGAQSNLFQFLLRILCMNCLTKFCYSEQI